MLKNRSTNCMLVALAAVCLIVISSLPAAAQAPSKPQVTRGAVANTPVHFDISPPLRDMIHEAGSAQFFGMHEANPPLHPKLQLLMDAAKKLQPGFEDGALQKSVGPNVVSNIGLDFLGVGTGFPGYSDPDAPPDTNMAVGDTQVLQWVNVSYAIFDKGTGAIIAGPIEGNTLWSGFGGTCQSDNSGDIIAQWDVISHRWFLTQNTFQGSYNTCIAVSLTDDATGSYFRYAYTQPGFPDYPKWGLQPQAYFQAQNDFGTGNFVGANLCAYQRSKMLVGDSSALQICILDNGGGTLFDDSEMPADLDSAANLPPAGQDEVYVGSIDNSNPGSNVYEVTFHVDFVVPSNSFLTGTNGTIPIAVTPYSLLCGGFSACITQPGVSDLLDSLGDRLMYRLAYDNFPGAGEQSWLINHSVVAGSSGGVRWYEFRAPESTNILTTYQQGTFAPDASYRWMGSIAMDANQDIAVGYSVSSSSVFPSIYYTGRQPGDPLGTMESEALIVSGAGSQPDTANRWGDYSGMRIDEDDYCTFWYTTEYYLSTATFNWSTQVASIKFPNCPAQPNFYLTVSPSSQTVVAGGSTNYTITATATNGFSGSINLNVVGLPSGATGTFSPNPILGGSGSSTLTVNTSNTTPAGTFFLVSDGSSGTYDPSTTSSLKVVASATLSFSPTSLGFGNQVENTTSASKTVTVTNNGPGSVSFTSIATNNSDYAITSNTCTVTLTSGQKCKVGVDFTPTKLGADNGGLVFTDNAAGSPQTVPMTGNGVLPVTLNPASANFGNVAENTPSNVHNFTLTNNQSVALTISSITTGNPDYTETDTCDGGIAAKSHCTISVTLTPTHLGPDNGTLTVNDNAPNNPQTASLTGNGVVPATLTPSSSNFGRVKVGSTSTSTFTLHNNAAGSISFTGWTITGLNSGDYSVMSTTCTGSLGGHASCSATVQFAPTGTGVRTATLNANDSASNSPQQSSMTGTGK